MNGARDVGTCT